MSTDELNGIKRLLREIESLKSEIMQRLDLIEQKQREIGIIIAKYEPNGTVFATGGSGINNAANNAADEIGNGAYRENRDLPGSEPDKAESGYENNSGLPKDENVKIEGQARKGMMSSLLEKYSD